MTAAISYVSSLSRSDGEGDREAVEGYLSAGNDPSVIFASLDATSPSSIGRRRSIATSLEGSVG